MTSLESLSHSVQLAQEWVNELDHALGWNNRRRSFRLLRATLQVLRDCLPLPEAAHFSAQLPLVLRGVFFEHWQPQHDHIRHWDLDHFFASIDRFFPEDPIEVTGDAVSAAFRVMANRIDPGEIAHVLACLPADIRALWPDISAL